MEPFVRLDPSDNVVTATRALEAGTEIEGVKTTGLIPSGHKIATRAIAKGEAVRKYAQLIGLAHEDIAPGDHVHTQNLDFIGTDVEYEFGTDQRPVEMVAEDARDTFMGYRRANGGVGTRNYIAIVTSVNCSVRPRRGPSVSTRCLCPICASRWRRSAASPASRRRAARSRIAGPCTAGIRAAGVPLRAE